MNDDETIAQIEIITALLRLSEEMDKMSGPMSSGWESVVTCRLQGEFNILEKLGCEGGEK